MAIRRSRVRASYFSELGGEAGGPVQNILLVGGGGGGLSSPPGQEVTHGTLHTSIRPKELSARHLFSGLEDADNTSLAFNITCPRSHFHTGSDVIVIVGITVYSTYMTLWKVKNSCPRIIFPKGPHGSNSQ